MSEVEVQEEEGGKSKKKAVLFAIAGVFVLTAAVGGAYLMGWFDSVAPAVDGQQGEIVEQKPVYFYDLPEMTVNLSTDGRKTYLKVRIALEVESESVVSEIEPYLPRIMDAFQIYLRELRPADLEGSSGLFRLKEQLLRRINLAVYPSKVDGVLFKEILIQ